MTVEFAIGHCFLAAGPRVVVEEAAGIVTGQGDGVVDKAVHVCHPNHHQVPDVELLLNGSQGGPGHNLMGAQVVLDNRRNSRWKGPPAGDTIRVADEAIIPIRTAWRFVGDLELVDVDPGIAEHHRDRGHFTPGWQLRVLADDFGVIEGADSPLHRNTGSLRRSFGHQN